MLAAKALLLLKIIFVLRGIFVGRRFSRRFIFVKDSERCGKQGQWQG
jgi:hypothetical protein